MLNPQRRNQLDGIVQKMVEVGEPDSNIQFVVDDFKKKYEYETQPQVKTAQSGGVTNFLGDITGLTGTAKAVGSIFAGPAAEKAGGDIATQTNTLIQKAKQFPVGSKERRDLLYQASSLAGQTSQRAETILTKELPTQKSAAGSMVKLGLNVATAGVAPGATLAGRLAQGAGYGAGLGVGGAMEKDKDIVSSAVIGGVIGLATAGTMELVGKGLRKLSQSEMMQNWKGRTYNKELQPPKKELTQQLEFNLKTLGKQVADVADDAGKPVYVGNYKTLQVKAENELRKKGTELRNILETFDNEVGETVTREQLAKGVREGLENTYGKLSPSQMKQMMFEINRAPGRMNMTKLEEVKRMYDGLIPESFWSSMDNPAIAFPTLVKYQLRDNARKLIGETVRTDVVNSLNQRLGIAMDVRHLSAAQRAFRETLKVGATQGGQSLWRSTIGKLFDDYIFNPATTTRLAQWRSNLGSKTGQTYLRKLGRMLATEEMIKTQK